MRSREEARVGGLSLQFAGHPVDTNNRVDVLRFRAPIVAQGDAVHVAGHVDVSLGVEGEGDVVVPVPADIIVELLILPRLGVQGIGRRSSSAGPRRSRPGTACRCGWSRRSPRGIRPRRCPRRSIALTARNTFSAPSAICPSASRHSTATSILLILVLLRFHQNRPDSCTTEERIVDRDSSWHPNRQDSSNLLGLTMRRDRLRMLWITFTSCFSAPQVNESA